LIALAAPVWRVCDFCLIFVPFGHYDEPETLPYKIRLVCSIGADVKQLIRRALQHIAPGRLIISSDCGFGCQGMSRTHAFYKMVSLVWGTNIVRQELGLEPRPILATDRRYALM